jgi:hypothetical protein
MSVEGGWVGDTLHIISGGNLALVAVFVQVLNGDFGVWRLQMRFIGIATLATAALSCTSVMATFTSKDAVKRLSKIYLR